MRAKHRVHLGNLLIENCRVGALVALAHHQVADGMRRCRAAFFGLSDNEHRKRHGVGRKVKQLAHFFLTFNDIADIAAAKPHGLCRDGCILSRDHGVLCRNGKLAQAGRDARALTRAPCKLGCKAARMFKQVDPLSVVDNKHQCPRRLCDHRLVVAQNRQAVARLLRTHVDDGIHHHGARRGRTACCMQNRGTLFVGDIDPLAKRTSRGTRIDEPKRDIICIRCGNGIDG